MTVKSRLLEILEKEKGETLSGEKLAEELHCTRAAIWKAVKSLREEGYMIEAGPNKGYMLVKANDRLSVEAIRPFFVVSGGLYQSLSGSGFYEPCSESGCYCNISQPSLLSVLICINLNKREQKFLVLHREGILYI